MYVWYTYVNIRTRKHSFFVPFGTRPCANCSAVFSEKVGNGAMLPFAKNTYRQTLITFICFEKPILFPSELTQRLMNLSLSLCSYSGNNATLADSPDRLVEHCTQKQEVMSSMGPLHEAVTWNKKTPRCKANNAVVPWKERILANFEWSDFFVFLVSLYCAFQQAQCFCPSGCFVQRAHFGDIVINFRTCICCSILDRITPWFL